MTDAARSVALSGILTALVRRSLPSAPMHAFNAPEAGTGKSKLPDCASMLVNGNLAPVIAQGRSDEETEKRLDSALLAGDAIVTLDNCSLPLRGDKLCQILTQQHLRVRVLGQSKNVEVPSNAAMFATGNNLEIEGDTTRRVVLCTIDAKVERPELREFAFDPPTVYKENRGAFVRDALTVLRAYVVAGRPTTGTKPLGSFEEWSRMVRDPLIWLGEADPCDTMEITRANDPAREQLRRVIYFWNEVFGPAPVTAQQVIAECAGEDKLEGRAGLRDALLGVSAAFVKGPTSIDPMRLGKYLSKKAGQIVDGYSIVKASHQRGYQFWRLEKS